MGSLGRLAISLPLPGLSARDCVELAQRAETEWGYPAIWLAETAGPDAFALAAAIAQATRRITIGTGVVPVYNRTPAVLAMAASTLAQLSGGRFVLGIGSSSHAIVDDWNGVPFEKPLTRVRETVAVLRQALAGEKTAFEGRTLRSRGFRLGSLPCPAVPIYVGALREKMLALAGELGDGLVVNLFPVSALPKMLAAHRAGAAKAGRDASGHEVVCRFQVAVTEDVPAARRLVRAAFAGYVAQPVYNAFFAWCGFEDEARAVREAFARRDRAASTAAMSDDLVDRVTILGSAERCRAQLAEFVAGGVTTPVLSPLTADRRAIEATFEAFAPARLVRDA
ncbi:MAG TPA: LLM class F420-dependent oxidoreductase [Myxococcota bacterium]|jgi:probable F420-dependent oxidoreductase|nr:LLM class F420-dependent oxidoreductase [Myxococcota bacterium]